MTESASTTGSKPVCFVLMPIADSSGYETGHFGRVYEHLLKPAIVAAGYAPLRADDAVKTDYIVVGIIQKIIESEMVVCDFSSRNANVMYELGIRHAFNKPVVLIKDRKTEKVFDIQGLRYTEYDESLRIDSVSKDIGRISSAISETATSTDRDLNSIVHLAGMKVAKLPEGKKISPDTEIILSAIGSIERRLNHVESRAAASDSYFVIDPRGAVLSSGERVSVGEKLYVNGKLAGLITGMDFRTQSMLIQTEAGDVFDIPSTSPWAKGFSVIPF